jgi:predicted MFS family arabinose efflux permease
VLGRISAVGQVGTFAALLMIFLLFHFHALSYRATFVILGFVAFLGALAIIRFPHLHEGQLRQAAPKRQAIVFRKDYRYYYLLVFLDGARQQVFFSFGLWVLVNHFGLDVAQISLVMMAVTFGCMITVSRLGRMIDRQGERRSLSMINVAYIVALVGYALSPTVLAACVFYCVYAIIAPLSYIGASTYLRKIATQADLAPSLAMGVTMQHAAAIVVPVAAGFILTYVGYQIPFYGACGVAVISVFVTLRLDPVKQKCAARVAADKAADAGALIIP